MGGQSAIVAMSFVVGGAFGIVSNACVVVETKPPPQGTVEEGGGRWEALPPLPNGPRQETAVVARDGEVVVLGGFNGAGAVVRDVEAWDPARGSWRRLADLPEPLHHANAAVIDEKIVVAGFLVGADFQQDGRVFIHDAASDTWTTGVPMPGSSARGAAGVAALDGHVYVFGGFANGSSARASRYDVTARVWEELPELPLPLDHLAAGVIDGKLYVVGGRSNGIQNVAASTFAFDPRTLEWTGRAPMPTARAGFAAAVVDGRFVVAGGEGNARDDSGVFSQVEAYDPVTDAWNLLVDMRTPRHGMGAAAWDGAMYVPGGADRQGFSAVDVHERFVLATSADEGTDEPAAE